MTTQGSLSSADLRLAPGVLLAGKYRLAEEIGAGGMGVVHAGEHLALKSRVAIKLLQPKLAQDATARARFLREARLAASIEGEHSTRIYDVGTHDGGQPFMVMEYLAGESLNARLQREERLSVIDATTVLVQLLDALAEAHSKGLVHRDLKPANLFLAERPGESIWVKVLDFGISKVQDGSESIEKTNVALTEPRTLLGSPEYMSPEQLRDSANVDSRADIWACGVILFELLAGTPPFAGASLPDLYARIVSREPRTLSSAGEMIPAPLARMIQRCLRKDPDQRPQTAYDLAVGLAPYASDSARALLPRIRAWCKSDAPLPDGPRSPHVVAGGLTVIALAGALAFVAASARAPTQSHATPSSANRASEVATLEPIPPASAPPVAPPTPPASAHANVIDPVGSAATASQHARPLPAGVEQPRRPRLNGGKKPGAPQDLDSIDLIR